MLFVVEGSKTDPKIVKAALDALGIGTDGTDGYSILSFGTHLHSLIRLIAGEAGTERVRHC